MVQRLAPSEPLTAILVSVPASVELAVRMCRILVLRLGDGRAVYLGCSILGDGFASGSGGGVEEEVCLVREVVGEVERLVGVWDQDQDQDQNQNGDGY